jgi:hypothetical protein
MHCWIVKGLMSELHALWRKNQQPTTNNYQAKHGKKRQENKPKPEDAPKK